MGIAVVSVRWRCARREIVSARKGGRPAMREAWPTVLLAPVGGNALHRNVAAEKQQQEVRATITTEQQKQQWKQ